MCNLSASHPQRYGEGIGHISQAAQRVNLPEPLM
jgi:hypothetical protein